MILVMNSRALIIGLILILLLAGIIALFLIRKYYLKYNILRFDPLEERILDTDLLIVPDNKNSIWLIGDSRIARWDRDHLSPLKAGINNLGIEGQTTAQVLNRLRNYLETAQPEWLILEAGINDLKIIGVKKEYESLIVEGCINNIISIIELCQKKNIGIILINIFPAGKIEFTRRFVWNSSVDSSIILVNKRLRDYCNINNVYFFDTDTILCDRTSVIKEQYQDGFLHVNDEAYKVLSNNLIKNFGSVINSDLNNKIIEVL